MDSLSHQHKNCKSSISKTASNTNALTQNDFNLDTNNNTSMPNTSIPNISIPSLSEQHCDVNYFSTKGFNTALKDNGFFVKTHIGM